MSSAELKKGHEYFRKSQVPSGLCRAIRLSYLEKAIYIYNSEVAKAPRDKIYAHRKNIGVTNFRLAELLDPKYADMGLLMFHLSEAVKNYCVAWESSPFAKTDEWSLQVEEYISDAFQSAFSCFQWKPVAQRFNQFYLLDKIEAAIGCDDSFNKFRFRFHMAKGQYFYRCGVEALAADDFKSIVRLCEYCREEGELAMKYAVTNDEKIQEIRRLEEDYSMLRCSSESMRHRKQADLLFDKYMNQAEEVNFDMMWEILDMYKAATLSCEEKDIENEAISQARQGRLFDKLFRIEPKAKTCFRRALDLAQVLFPRDVSKMDWYNECTEALERYQQKLVQEEEARKEKERAQYLPKIKEALDKLNEVASRCDSFELLKHVYATHPPKTVKFTYNEKQTNSSNIKKTLMKAITHYHPDKQVRFGMEWKVLCEEITKNLTARYECMKGV